VTGVEVKLDDPFAARQMRATRPDSAGLLGARWMEMNKNLFAALQPRKLALFVIVTIIVLVPLRDHRAPGAAGPGSARKIGILKALGAPGREHHHVFFTVA